MHTAREYWAILRSGRREQLKEHQSSGNILMEGGRIRKRRAIPPMEKPIICVDITNLQEYGSAMIDHLRMNTLHPLV